jgi:glucan 1,3-beta-glucosidase
LSTDHARSYRSIRNFIIDLTGAPASGVTGLHWQVSQGTSLMNIVVEMGKGSQHQGMFMEVRGLLARSEGVETDDVAKNGSGGFMGDLVFIGGKIGMWLGNQQFTVRNVTINDAATAVHAAWNWGWTYQGERPSTRNTVYGVSLTFHL